MSQRFKPEQSVSNIPLIGAAKAGLLEKLGILTIKDLLFHIPFKYRDTSDVLSIERFKEEKEGTILAQVLDIKNAYTRSRKVITKAIVADESGRMNIIWFNQPYLTKAIKAHETYLFEGKIPNKPGAKDLTAPSYEKYAGDISEQTHIGKITPYYSETEGVSSKWLRSRINHIKGEVEGLIADPIPKDILKEENLLNLADAILKIHFPKSLEEIEKARERLGFDEMLKIALQIEQTKNENRSKKGIEIEVSSKDTLPFTKSLPFELTLDQAKAIDEIITDLNKSNPMRRLLNGDVGSGKTAVAAATAYAIFTQGYSTLLMAPTTILAKQHFDTLKKYLEPLGVPVQSKISGKGEIDIGKTSVIVGTHALLHLEELPTKIGMVVVDEQHRFGVGQRHELLKEDEKGRYPHYLSMSATPIPRTLTNVLFGDMDVSFIREMPSNRKSVKTHYVPYSKRESCLEWVKDRVEQSNFTEQAFIIFPLVDESEKLEAKSAKAEYEKLKKGTLKGLKIGLIHGQMKNEEKEKVLNDFRTKKYSVLVATPVVEVGIDIPDATIMVIENAERFGLAQLHQFRGRVGRGDMQSFCYIIAGEHMQEIEGSVERLKYFSFHNSGFDVAEFDLQNRGPGEVYGLKQAGVLNLKVASISDIELLIKCRDNAREIINRYPAEIDNIFENSFK